MKFTIEREILLETLTNVSRGLSDKKPFPVLTGIKIAAKEQQLTFITTNKEISVKIDLLNNDKILVEKEGTCVVPGKFFVEIVKKIEGKLIEFTLFETKTIKIISERSDFTLVAFEESLFPLVNFDKEGEPVRFESRVFKQMIKQTSFATASSESRIVLTSVNFRFENNELSITATDSFRLARKKIDNVIINRNTNINIPGKSLEEFGKILEDSNDYVEMYILGRTVLFEYKNVAFITRLVEGTYPDTSSLFPKDYLMNIRFNKNELISAVDRASLFSSAENLSLVKMIVNDKSTIEISSNSTEIGKVTEEIYPLEISEKRNFQIAFSIKYLMEAIKSFESNEIIINFTGEIKPAVIKSKNKEDLVQLILPVRVF